jgi:hypothetical protein
MKTILLSIEAIIAGTPCFLLAMLGAPIFLFSGISMLGDKLADGATNILFALGLVVALSQYVHLTLKTIAEKIFHFGLWFWLSILFSLAPIYLTFTLFSFGHSLLIVLPITITTFHFCILQLRLRKLKSKLINFNLTGDCDAK